MLLFNQGGNKYAGDNKKSYGGKRKYVRTISRGRKSIEKVFLRNLKNLISEKTL